MYILSIRKGREGVATNSNSRIDSKESVEQFLSELKEILESDTFEIKRDLDILPKKKKESAADPYTTANTMAALEFDANDLCFFPFCPLS